jgi:hypothetical protein
MTVVKSSPDVRVRKIVGYWCVQRRKVIDNHPVWEYVAGYSSWSIAFAVAQVEASPDEWPFYFREIDHHIEECS